MFSPIITSQENNIVPISKAIIQTQVAENANIIIMGGKFNKTTIRVHYKTETTSKLNVT